MVQSSIETVIFHNAEKEDYSLAECFCDLQEEMTDFMQEFTVRPENILSVQTCSHLNRHGYTVTIITLVYKSEGEI